MRGTPGGTSEESVGVHASLLGPRLADRLEFKVAVDVLDQCLLIDLETDKLALTRDVFRLTCQAMFLTEFGINRDGIS